MVAHITSCCWQGAALRITISEAVLWCKFCGVSNSNKAPFLFLLQDCMCLSTWGVGCFVQQAPAVSVPGRPGPPGEQGPARVEISHRGWQPGPGSQCLSHHPGTTREGDSWGTASVPGVGLGRWTVSGPGAAGQRQGTLENGPAMASLGQGLWPQGGAEMGSWAVGTVREPQGAVRGMGALRAVIPPCVMWLFP